MEGEREGRRKKGRGERVERIYRRRSALALNSAFQKFRRSCPRSKQKNIYPSVVGRNETALAERRTALSRIT
jgi:hypothetical protein